MSMCVCEVKYAINIVSCCFLCHFFLPFVSEYLFHVSVGTPAGQESAGSTDVDSWFALVNECNTGVGPRAASCCNQHSGLYPFFTDCSGRTNGCYC